MNLWRLLTLPGYAMSEMARYVWLALGALALSGAILFAVLTYADTLRWILAAAYVWAMVNACAWVFLANVVFLGRAARVLRLPRLVREVLVGLALYGVLSIVVPTLVLGLAGGHWLSVAIIVLFGAGVGAAYALFPTYIAVWVFFSSYIPAALSPWLPQAMQPGFNAWAAPAVALLWLVLAWRIRGLMWGRHSLKAPHGPTLLIFRQRLWGSGTGGESKGWGLRAPGRGPAWAQPRVDLGGCGPEHVERSLRVALGGWWLPQTWLSRLRQCLLLLAGVAAGALFLLVQVAADGHDHRTNLVTDLGGAGSVAFFGTVIIVMFAIATVRSLYQRWGSANAELPLLALLPGLGTAPDAKRSLWRASLLPAVGVQLGLGALLLILAGVLQLGRAGEVVLLLASFGSAALLCVFALMTFGGGPLRGWGSAWAMGAGYVWICLNGAIMQFNAEPAVAFSQGALLILAVGWSAFYVAVLWLGQRAWCGLKRRPHAFMPTGGQG